MSKRKCLLLGTSSSSLFSNHLLWKEMLLWSCRALCPERNHRCSMLQSVRNYHVVFHLLDCLQQADFGAWMRSYRAKHRNCCSVVVFSPLWKWGKQAGNWSRDRITSLLLWNTELQLLKLFPPSPPILPVQRPFLLLGHTWEDRGCFSPDYISPYRSSHCFITS